MSPVGAIFVPCPPKTGKTMLHPLPPQLLNLSSNHLRGAQGRCGGGGVEAEMNENQDSRERERGGAYAQNSTAATFERP